MVISFFFHKSLMVIFRLDKYRSGYGHKNINAINLPNYHNNTLELLDKIIYLFRLKIIVVACGINAIS